MKRKKLKIVSVIVVICILFGMNYVNQLHFDTRHESDNVFDSKWGLSREQFNYDLKVPGDEKTIEIANDLLNEKLIVYHTMESLPYNFDDFDWNVTVSDSPSSYQLYLQSLTPMVYLTNAYELTKKKEYLDLSKRFLEEWDKYRLSDMAKSNPFVWYDHGSALRADNIIYFVLSAEAGEEDYFSLEEKEWIYSLLGEHAEFLSQDENYTKDHNHGIFQDQALLYCAYFLNDNYKEERVATVKRRLLEQKEYAFTNEMVHVENSPGYQTGVMELFRVIAEFCCQFKAERDFGNILYNDIKGAAEFMAYIIKPNGLVAEVGDTSSSLKPTGSTNSALKVFENEHLTYAVTSGKEGKKPEEKSKIYPDSGYYISRNDWSENDSGQSTWMMFKSGYSSRTHKHADDNSFMLYSKGQDLFVDPGWYNYISGNFYRDYLVSSNAHNTVIVDGKTYSPTVENSSKVGIYEYTQNENYDYVMGFNEMYNDVSFDRHFYNLGDAVIIYDNIESSSKHTYSQLLHASETMRVIEKGNDEILYAIGGGILSECGSFLKMAKTTLYMAEKRMNNLDIFQEK